MYCYNVYRYAYLSVYTNGFGIICMRRRLEISSTVITIWLRIRLIHVIEA